MQAGPGRGGVPWSQFGPPQAVTDLDEHDVTPADPDALIPLGRAAQCRTPGGSCQPHDEAGQAGKARPRPSDSSEMSNDTAPSVTDGVEFPVHVLAVNALGLHLMDYLEFSDLAPLCEQQGRWSFLCVIAPLRLPTGTGSPVNPIAIL